MEQASAQDSSEPGEQEFISAGGNAIRYRGVSVDDAPRLRELPWQEPDDMAVAADLDQEPEPPLGGARYWYGRYSGFFNPGAFE
jgi:hypothetical protein